MKRVSRSVAAILLLAGLAVVLPSCGGGGDNNPSRTVIGTRSFALGVLEAGSVDVTITGSGTGTLDASANWGSAANDIDIYVTSTSCTDIFFGGCSIQAQANSSTAKPERLTLGVSGGSVYRIWVANFGPGSDSGQLEVGLTR